MGIQKEIVLPILLTDYETTRREYLSYDKEYSAKFVYTAWKEEYISIRFHMGLLLQLMNYYYTLECEEYLSEAVRFKDPLIAEKAVIVSLIKHVKVEEEVLLQLAENLESAEDFYWDLKGSNKENLYPIKDKKQPIIAKSKLFTHLVYMQDEEDERLLGKFPEHINVLDSIDTENQYGQPVRYYLLSFKESGTDYVGWAGGFSLEDGDDTAHVWEGTYTDFVELDAKSIEQHKDEFLRSAKTRRNSFMMKSILKARQSYQRECGSFMRSCCRTGQRLLWMALTMESTFQLDLR